MTIDHWYMIVFGLLIVVSNSMILYVNSAMMIIMAIILMLLLFAKWLYRDLSYHLLVYICLSCAIIIGNYFTQLSVLMNHNQEFGFTYRNYNHIGLIDIDDLYQPRHINLMDICVLIPAVCYAYLINISYDSLH